MSGSIRGIVVRAGSGRPVPDVTIVVLRGAGPAPDIGPLTNEDGAFALDGLPAGDWRLRAVGPDGERAEETVRVFDDAATDLTFTLLALHRAPPSCGP